MKQFDKSKLFVNQSLEIAKKNLFLERMSMDYLLLFEINSYQKKYKEALNFFLLHYKIKDSIFNISNTESTVRTQMNYDFDKKESLQKAEQDKKTELAKKELLQQKRIRNIFIFGFILMLLFALIIYNQRNKISKARKKSDELLLNILPEEIAEELKKNGSTEAKQYDEVTVLFTDFVNFTGKSSVMEASTLVEEINKYFTLFDSIMEKYGIEKIKTIGDAYFAVGGLPTKNNSHPIDILKAAFEILAVVSKIKEENSSSIGQFFEIRIGIHTGPVVAGVVGLKKFQYDVWGDTVNTASRMESNSEVGKINISDSTYQKVKGEPYKFIPRGKVAVKGKGEIEMYFVEKIV